MLLLKTQSFLQALSSISLGGILKAILGYIFLAIDSVVYFFVSQGFKMYIALAQFKLFDDKVFNDLINRTYIIIGVIALFIVAYALLNSIINPDNASKGDKSLSKIVKNFIFAIIGIAIVPTVFNYFYYFQRVVLCNNLIPKILLAQKGDDSQADLLNDDKIGTQFATYLFQSFFYPKSIENMNMTDVDNDGDLLKSEAAKVEVGYIGEAFDFEESVNAEKFKQYDKDNTGKYNLQMAYEAAMDGEMFFTAFRIFLLGGNGFANSVLNNTVNYMIIVSTIAGVYCAYVLASLCIDMAIRAVKLGYLELIAPLPIMTLIIPGKDGVFKAWIKKTGSCAFEVFTRLFIVSFVIYLIRTIPQLFTATSFSYGGCTTSFGIITALLIRALVYCGLLTFLKQAPKFLSEATGIKSDGFKLGIADKLGEMALIGGAAKNGVRAAQGAATGALGGLATGLFNRDKINWKSAAMQGATQGFKGKGNQFSKQRKSTFQSIGEYEDKDQGIFGGESKVSKFINDHKKDVKNDYTEHGSKFKQEVEEGGMMHKLKRENFRPQDHDQRLNDFKRTAIMKDAENYARQQMKVNGTYSEQAYRDAIETFLEQTRATTQDKNLARSIYQYQKEKAADDIFKNIKKYTDDELAMSNQQIVDAQKQMEADKKSLEDTKSDITKKIDNITARRQEILSSFSKINADIKEANSRLQDPNLSQDERIALETQKRNLEASVRNRNNLISSLEAQLGTFNTQKTQLETDIKNIDDRQEHISKLADDRTAYINKVNEMAKDIVLGKGSLTVDGVDFMNTVSDNDKDTIKYYRGYDSGIEAATKVTTTEDKLLEEMKKFNANNKKD